MEEKLKKVLFALMDSHSRLAKAEYRRDDSYNNEHFSYKAEDGIVKYLEENEPDILKEYLDAR